MRIAIPQKAALLAEALAVEVERGDRVRSYDLRGRILGTDAGGTRLFAIRPSSLEPAGAPAGGRGARMVRESFQGEASSGWLAVRARIPAAARHLGTARRIFYRSDKHGGRRASYVHEFSSPAPAVYRAGSHFFFVGGRKRVGSRGIEG